MTSEELREAADKATAFEVKALQHSLRMAYFAGYGDGQRDAFNAAQNIVTGPGPVKQDFTPHEV